MDIIGVKPAPGDQEYNFKKVGAIPCEPLVSNTQKYLLFYQELGHLLNYYFE